MDTLPLYLSKTTHHSPVTSPDTRMYNKTPQAVDTHYILRHNATPKTPKTIDLVDWIYVSTGL